MRRLCDDGIQASRGSLSSSSRSTGTRPTAFRSPYSSAGIKNVSSCFYGCGGWRGKCKGYRNAVKENVGLTS